MAGLLLAAVGCTPDAAPGSNTSPVALDASPATAASVDEALAGDLGFGTNGDPNVRLEMHRKGAGAPDAQGWSRATSAGGSFAVDLPNLFQDFTMTVKVKDQAANPIEVETFCLGTRDKKLVKFVATGMKGSDGKLRVASLEDLVKSFETRGLVLSKRPVEMGNFAGIELELGDQIPSAVLRICLTADTVYQLIVEPPSGVSLNDIVGEIKRFFESFALVR